MADNNKKGLLDIVEQYPHTPECKVLYLLVYMINEFLLVCQYIGDKDTLFMNLLFMSIKQKMGFFLKIIRFSYNFDRKKYFDVEVNSEYF